MKKKQKIKQRKEKRTFEYEKQKNGTDNFYDSLKRSHYNNFICDQWQTRSDCWRDGIGPNGRWEDEDDDFVCTNCNVGYCGYCTTCRLLKCDQCRDAYICPHCLTKCSTCNSYECQKCLNKNHMCQYCQQNTCKLCSNWCHYCSAKLCCNCIYSKCPVCQSDICLNCMIIGCPFCKINEQSQDK